MKARTEALSWLSTLCSAAVLALLGAAAGACDPPQPDVPDPMLIADPPPTEDGQMPGAGTSDYDRGVAYIKNQDWPKAIEHLDQALKLGPNNAKAEYYRALAKEQLKDRPGAEQGYARALELDPELIDAAINLGAIYLDEPARPAEAVKVLKLAVRKDPGAVDARRNLAYAHQLLKQYDQAEEHYKAAIALSDTPELRFAYGEMLLLAGKSEDAAKHLAKALEAYKKDLASVVLIADMLGRAGAAKECVQAYDLAVSLKSDEKKYYLARGICKRGTKDEAAARKDFREALKLDKSYAAAHFFLGESYWAEKSIKSAEDAYRQAIKHGSGTKYADRARQRIKEMSKP